MRWQSRGGGLLGGDGLGGGEKRDEEAEHSQEILQACMGVHVLLDSGCVASRCGCGRVKGDYRLAYEGRAGVDLWIMALPSKFQRFDG